MSTEEGSESKELLRLREAVLVLTQEQRVQEQNSRQREFFDTFDLGAGGLIYWYLSKESNGYNRARMERDFMSVVLAFVTKFFTTVALVAAAFLILEKFVAFSATQNPPTEVSFAQYWNYKDVMSDWRKVKAFYAASENRDASVNTKNFSTAYLAEGGTAYTPEFWREAYFNNGGATLPFPQMIRLPLHKKLRGFNGLNLILMMVFGLYVELIQILNYFRNLPLQMPIWKKSGYAKWLVVIEHVETWTLVALTFILLGPYVGLKDNDFEIVLNGVALLFIADMDEHTINLALDKKLVEEIKLWYLEHSGIFETCRWGYFQGVSNLLKDAKGLTGRLKASTSVWDSGQKISMTPLMIAADRGHLDIVRALVRKLTPELVQFRNDTGHTALWFACRNGKRDVVQALLDSHDADVDRKDMEKLDDLSRTTPLFVACLYGNDSVVQLLLSLPEAKHMVGISSYHLEDQKLYTPLEIAEKLGHVGIVEMLTNVSKEGPQSNIPLGRV